MCAYFFAWPGLAWLACCLRVRACACGFGCRFPILRQTHIHRDPRNLRFSGGTFRTHPTFPKEKRGKKEENVPCPGTSEVSSLASWWARRRGSSWPVAWARTSAGRPEIGAVQGRMWVQKENHHVGVSPKKAHSQCVKVV